MRDILYPLANHFRDSSSIEIDVTDAMPSHPPQEYPPLDRQVPSTLIDLINNSTQRDPRRRPSARSVVAALEGLQRELCMEVASRMMFDLQQFDDPMSKSRHVVGMGGAAPAMHRFTGVLAADRIVDRNFVNSPMESVRMGNAFMDAGLLHHVTHSRRFNNSTELYFFDSMAALYRNSISSNSADFNSDGSSESPTHLQLKRTASAAQDRFPDSTIPMLSSFHGRRSHSRSLVLLPNGDCACRRLAQRQEPVGILAPLGGGMRTRLVDSLHRTKKQTTPILAAVSIEDELEMELTHAFGGLGDDSESKKQSLALSA